MWILQQGKCSLLVKQPHCCRLGVGFFPLTIYPPIFFQCSYLYPEIRLIAPQLLEKEEPFGELSAPKRHVAVLPAATAVQAVSGSIKIHSVLKIF